jgi:hypothetical protein
MKEHTEKKDSAERMVEGLRKEKERNTEWKKRWRQKERKYSHLKYTYPKPLNVRRDVNHTN